MLRVAKGALSGTQKACPYPLIQILAKLYPDKIKMKFG